MLQFKNTGLSRLDVLQDMHTDEHRCVAKLATKPIHVFQELLEEMRVIVANTMLDKLQGNVLVDSKASLGLEFV